MKELMQPNNDIDRLVSEKRDRLTSAIRQLSEPGQGKLVVVERELVMGSLSDWPFKDFRPQAVDVVFTQGTNAANLKDYLSGDYWISHQPAEDVLSGHGGYSRAGFIGFPITGREEDGQLENLILLHEAGHQVDDRINKELYRRLRKAHLLEDMRSELLSTKMVCPTADLYSSSAFLPRATSLSRDDFNAVRKSAREYVGEIDAIDNRNELEKLHREHRTRSKTVLTQLKSSEEYGAWYLAINALVEMRKDGVGLYTGTREEFCYIINSAMATYRQVGIGIQEIRL